MAINGNVIRCDECGRQISMPMELDASGKKSLEERVRSFATSQGWTCGNGIDFCPTTPRAIHHWDESAADASGHRREDGKTIP